jgi:FkbM family methyltransferase
VVDAGAFVGDSALYFANLGAEVYSYEPDPANFARLQKNLMLNACGTRVHPMQKAVGIDGTIAFRFGHGGGSEGYLGDAQRTGPRGSVESVSLETIVQTLPQAPFLLKADIKGAEYDIVRQPAIRRFERLQIEYNGREGDGLPFLLNELASQGFQGIACNPNRGQAPLSKWGLLRMYRVTSDERPASESTTAGPPSSADEAPRGRRDGPPVR